MIDAFGWKSIFYMVLVVMVISFFMACMVFDDVLELQDKKFDFLSFAESIFAFGGIKQSNVKYAKAVWGQNYFNTLLLII
jgi:hypothetical protein